jgi:hypothetical protein
VLGDPLMADGPHVGRTIGAAPGGDESGNRSCHAETDENQQRTHGDLSMDVDGRR